MKINYDRKNLNLARGMRCEMTPWERKLWFSYLSSYPIRFRRQAPIGGYILDFYCCKAGIALELDGGGHYFPAQQVRDSERTESLAALGIQVFRICNTDVDNNLRGVCEWIDMLVQERMQSM